MLSWHGQESGGVRIPFSTRSGNPLKRSLETRLLAKVRALAAEQARGGQAPRWVFLVGGPGNGKSEAVEAYVRALDEALGAGGSLMSALATAYAPDDITRRAVIQSSAVPQLGRSAEELIIVQDATAADTAYADAAAALAEDIRELLGRTTPPLYLCCANRGILARAIGYARQAYGQGETLTALVAIARATSMSDEALREAPASWPIHEDHRFAAWPLDVESIVETQGAASAILQEAVDEARWERSGICGDCDSRDLCPMRQNAESLRNGNRQEALLHTLRHVELGSGQRWSFRDTFSLVAELIVGQRSDFHPFGHPCGWVHANVDDIQAAVSPDEKTRQVLNLVERHHAQAMFPAWPIQRAARKLVKDAARQPITQSIAKWFASRKVDTTKHIREALLDEGVRFLDPADSSPGDATHPLIAIENAYSQSVGFALTRPEFILSMLEREALELLSQAEAEWDGPQRDSAKAAEARHFIVTVAATIHKRSEALRSGRHPRAEELDAYASTLRDQARLNELRIKLGRLLWEDGFRASLTATFGQPIGRREGIVELVGRKPYLRILPAPGPTNERAGHDLPVILMDAHVTPVTYDLYASIQRASMGCTEASMPTAVRAALDRLRTSHLGVVARDRAAFARDEAHVEIANAGRIILQDVDGSPLFIEASGGDPPAGR